jgi:type II secretory pathway pseudopilin PulG
MGRTRREGQFGPTCRRSAGLTLIEMLTVVGIIMLLAGLVVTLTRHVDNQSKEKALSNTFALLKGALREYYDFNDVFPVMSGVTPVNRAASLYTQLNSVPASRQVLQQIDQKLVTGGAIYDPWGMVIDYKYQSGDTFPELISAGPDKLFGTVDDISSRNL